MIDIKHKKCFCGQKQPIFNFEGESKAIYCSECKKPGMIDIKSKKCFCGQKQPSFNFEGESKAVYCSECKKPGMIDIKHKKCFCGTRTSYGIPHNLPVCCSMHKTVSMISKPRSRCLKRGCKNIAEYGINRPIHCDEHKNINDINLVERLCVKCGKIDVLDKFNLCINFCNTEEEYEKYKKRQKLKESVVYSYLKEKIVIQPTLFDKIIVNDCGILNRPDIVYELKTHVVIIEIDENQHKSSYCDIGEVNRIKNIFTVYGGEMPVVFIRYNPDNFKVVGKVVKVPKTKRLDVLVRWVKKSFDYIPNDLISIVYLYYDNYKDTLSDFYKIDPYKPYQVCDKCGKINFQEILHEC